LDITIDGLLAQDSIDINPRSSTVRRRSVFRPPPSGITAPLTTRHFPVKWLDQEPLMAPTLAATPFTFTLHDHYTDFSQPRCQPLCGSSYVRLALWRFPQKQTCIKQGKTVKADLLLVVLQNEEGRASIVRVEASLGSLKVVD